MVTLGVHCFYLLFLLSISEDCGANEPRALVRNVKGME